VDVRQRFAFLPDFPLFFPTMSIIEHCAMTLRLYGRDDEGAEARVIELMRRFDILPLANSQLGALSRGQVYKAALVAIFAAGPELLMFDEPMASGMDALGLREFRDEVRLFTARGGTVLYTTQITSVAEQFSDDVILLHKGRLHASGPLPSLAQGRAFEEIFAGLRGEP
jgi:ABC-2 type transport system ATP-binding protein